MYLYFAIFTFCINSLFAFSPKIAKPDTVQTSKDFKEKTGETFWNKNLTAKASTQIERYYSWSDVSILNNGKWESVAFPSYKDMTGFPKPNVEDLRPRGRDSIIGWTKEGLLVYSIWRSPLASFSGNDPLYHHVYLKVSSSGMEVVKVVHDKGKWKNGDWIKEKPKESSSEKTILENKSQQTNR